MTSPVLVLFVDSNVLIEALFVRRSAAATVVDMSIKGTFQITTCQQVVEDVEKAILSKLSKFPDNLDTVVARWEKLKTDSRLVVIADESLESSNRTYHEYISVMRHKADIPILAAAIRLNPSAILSGNREHFNAAVASKSGIPICSCSELLELIARHNL